MLGMVTSDVPREVILRKRGEVVHGAQFKQALRDRMLITSWTVLFLLFYFIAFITISSYIVISLVTSLLSSSTRNHSASALLRAVFPGSSTKHAVSDSGKAGMNDHLTWVGLHWAQRTGHRIVPSLSPSTEG